MLRSCVHHSSRAHFSDVINGILLGTLRRLNGPSQFGTQRRWASSPTRKLRARLERLLVSQHGIDLKTAKEVAKEQAKGWRRVAGSSVESGELPTIGELDALAASLAGVSGEGPRTISSPLTVEQLNEIGARSKHRLRHLTVALVGRPNAGKSTLFNRLSGKRTAIVNSTPGTTRDWREEEGALGDMTFTLLDTAGLEDSAERAPASGRAPASAGTIGLAEARARQRDPALAFEDRMLAHTERAVRAADLAVFLIDGRRGVTEGDREFAAWLRKVRGGSPCILCANKTEGYFDQGEPDGRWLQLEAEAVRLGLGHPVPVSAEHGESLVELHDAMLPFAQEGTGSASSDADDGEEAAGHHGALSPMQMAARVEAEEEGKRLVAERVAAVRRRAGLSDTVGPSDSKVRGLTSVGPSRGDAADLQAVEQAAENGSEPESPYAGWLDGGSGAAGGSAGGEVEGGTKVEAHGGRRASEQQAWDVDYFDDASLDQALKAAESVNEGTAAASDAADEEQRPLHVCIVGRPNVGKSTLTNTLLGTERVLAGPTPGLTRDATEVEWTYEGRTVRLVDTAGMRRWGVWDMTTPLEALSVSQAKRALGRSNVVLLVVDAQMGVTKQDASIAQQVVDEGRGLVVVINKIDAVPNLQHNLVVIRQQLDNLLQDCKGTMCVGISAEAGFNVGGIMPAVMKTYDAWNSRVPTGRLNQWFKATSAVRPPPASPKTVVRRGSGRDRGQATKGSPLKIKFLCQISSRPPTFAMFANRPDVPDHYVRFLTNQLRQDFGLWGVPVRLLCRAPSNPYNKRASGGVADAGMAKRRKARSGVSSAAVRERLRKSDKWAVRERIRSHERREQRTKLRQRQRQEEDYAGRQ